MLVVFFFNFLYSVVTTVELLTIYFIPLVTVMFNLKVYNIRKYLK